MKHRKPLGILLAASLVISACHEEFNPKGSHKDELVVFAVLSAQNDTQFVRVYMTYDPPGYDPVAVTVDNPVTDAQVLVNGAGSAYQLRDTMVTRKDKSRYTSDIRAYVGFPMPIQAGATYNLTVNSPTRGSATSLATVPDHAQMAVVNPYVLDKPKDFLSQDVNIQIVLSPSSKGYVLRAYLVFQYVANSVTVTDQIEIPSVARDVDGQVLEGFPGLTRRTSQASSTSTNREQASIQNRAYRSAIDKVNEIYGNLNLRYRFIRFILTQVEPNFYNYYNIANGFQDQFTIRTDQPDYSNIRGGVGVFGAATADTLIYSLPLGFTP